MRGVLLVAAAVSVCALASIRHAHLDVAYVVFDGEIVAVDTSAHRVLKRLDIIGYLKPAEDAVLGRDGQSLILSGQRPDQGWGLLEVGLPDLVVRQNVRLRREPDRLSSVRPRGLCAAEGNQIILTSSVVNPDESISPRVLEVLDGTSLRSLHRVEIQPDKNLCPDEAIVSYALSSDGTQLLVVTSQGQSWQSFLRCYSFPALEPTGVIPLLKIYDDAPFKVLVP